MALTDEDILEAIRGCDIEDPRTELLYGEAERRNIDI